MLQNIYIWKENTLVNVGECSWNGTVKIQISRVNRNPSEQGEFLMTGSDRSATVGNKDKTKKADVRIITYKRY